MVVRVEFMYAIHLYLDELVVQLEGVRLYVYDAAGTVIV